MIRRLPRQLSLTRRFLQPIQPDELDIVFIFSDSEHVVRAYVERWIVQRYALPLDTRR